MLDEKRDKTKEAIVERPADSWAKSLASVFPELEASVEENTEGYPYLQVHLFLFDVQDWAERLYRADPKSARLRLLLDELDSGYLLDDEVIRNALEASFVEDFGCNSPVLPLFGPRLRAVARRMFPQSPWW